MGRLAGRISAGLLLISLGVGTFWLAGLLGYLHRAGFAEFSESASFVLTLLGLLVELFGRIAGWLRAPQPIMPEETAAARVRLAAALHASWRDEESPVYDVMPMRVCFAPWCERAGQSAGRAGDGSRAGPGGQGLAGDIDGVVSAFSREPRYRRVVMGAAGSGKTVLVTEFQRQMLEKPDEPLPVIVPAAGWMPDKQSLLDWLGEYLAGSYAGLTAEHARALVADGMVLPILDGLDEMDSTLQHQAIKKINKHLVRWPLVVTSREDQYRDATHVNGAGITAAAVVSIESLLPDDIRLYLDPDGGRHWAKVLSQVATSPGGVLATALSSPLMLWLASIIYQDQSPDRLTRFTNSAAVEDHLLRGLLSAVYGNDPRRLGPGRYRCTLSQAQRWLGYLAQDKHQSQPGHDERGSVDLAWWRLHAAEGPWRLLGIALRGALLAGLAAALAFWVMREHGYWRHGIHGPVQIRTLLTGPGGVIARQFTHGIPGAIGRILVALVKFDLHVIGWFWHYPLLLLWGVPSLIGGVISEFGHGPELLPIRPVRHRQGLGRALASICVMIGVGVCLLLLLLHFRYPATSTQTFFRSWPTWAALLAISLTGLIRTPSTFARRSDTAGALNPTESLQLDQQADVVNILVSRSAIVAATWLIFGTQIAIACLLFCLGQAFLALTIGGQGGYASRQYHDTRTWLAIRGPVAASARFERVSGHPRSERSVRGADCCQPAQIRASPGQNPEGRDRCPRRT